MYPLRACTPRSCDISFHAKSFRFQRCLALVFLHFSGNLKSWKYLFEFFISSSNLKPFQFHLALAIFCFTQNLFCFRRCLALVFLHFRLNTVTFCLELTKKTRRRVYSFIFFTAIAELEFSLRNNETENSSNNQQLKIYLF